MNPRAWAASRTSAASLAGLVFLAGTAGSGAAALMMRDQGQARATESLDRRTATVERAVTEQTQRYVDALRTSSAAAGAFTPLTAAKFAALTEPLASMNLPGTTSIVFVARPVTTPDVPGLEQLWRDRGASGLTLAPAPGVEHVFPIFSRPLDGQGTKPAGRDLSASAALTAALAESRRSSAPAITDTYRLLIDRTLPAAQQQLSFSLLSPVWSAATRPSGQRTFQGWVLLGIRGQDFIRDVLARSTERAVDVELLAAGQTGAAERVAGLRAAYADSRDMHRTVAVRVAQRQWELRVDASSASLTGGGRTATLLVVVGGGLLSALLALLVLVLGTARVRASDQVRAATADLRAAEAAARRDAALLAAVVDSISDGVGVVDENGVFLLHNRAAKALLGVDEDSDGTDTWAEHYGMYVPDGSAPYPTGQMPLVRALAGEDCDDTEVLLRAPGREDTVLTVSARPLDAAAGQRGAVSVFRDVTAERARAAELVAAYDALKQAQADLAARQEFTDALLDTMEVGVMACDATGAVTYVNRQTKALHGFDPDAPSQPVGTWADHVDVYVPDGVTPVPFEQLPMFRALREGHFADAELVIAPHGGSRRNLVLHGRAIRDAGGGIRGAVVAAHDITALVQGRDALRRSEANLRAAFDSSLVGNLHTAPDGSLLQVNQAAADMLGYSIEELRSVSWGDITHPEDVAASREMLQRALAGDTGAFSLDKRYLHKAGHVVHIHLSTTLLRDEVGEPVHFVTQLIDVSARTLAEQALRDQRDLYVQLMQALSDLGEGVTIAQDGRFAYANDAYCRLTGRTLDELLTLPTTLDLCPDDELPVWRGFMTQRAGGGVVAPLQTAVLNSAGGQTPVEVATLAVPSSGGVRYVSVTRDLSDRVRAQAELTSTVGRLEATVEKLQAANQFKDDVVAMLSHDLRQPLTATIGFCELVLDDWDALTDEARRDFIARAGRAGHWVNDLLEDILTMARMDQARPVPQTRAVDVAAAVSEVVARLGADAAYVDLGAVQDVQALTDASHFQQVLANLVGNALKYGSAPVTVIARQVAGTVVLDVVDSGEGVPAEFVPHLFERFTRAATGAALQRKGSGLGLYIAHTLADANAGTLSYQPASGRGARFSLTLPAAGARPTGTAASPGPRAADTSGSVRATR